jgi:hypothetical protein
MLTTLDLRPLMPTISDLRSWLRRAWLLAAVAACDPTGAHGARSHGRGPERIWGVTVDDVWNTQPTADALARLPRRATARVVLDVGPAPTEYVEPVTTVHRVADIMGELVDSSRLAEVTLEEYAARTDAFLEALGRVVDVWEIGNEVNGEWTGDSKSVAAKIRVSYDAVKARGGRTALTLFYNRGCAEDPHREVFRWASEHLPPALRRGIDQVWLSYYEEDCPGVRPDWQAEFDRLGELFPSAALGIGECGARGHDRKAEVLERCYRIAVDHPRFVGGGFWWHFSEDMVPASKPLWSVLAQLMAGDPG